MRFKGYTFARKIMLLDHFSVRFPDEDACVAYFREIRTVQGVVCTQCGKTTHKWIKGKNAFQCETCGCRMPLTKGTVMEHSKLTMRHWFYTMHLMTSIKQVLSAKEVQHQLGVDEYPPAVNSQAGLKSFFTYV